MEHGWRFADDIGLVDYQDVFCWNGYVALLKASYLRLNNDADVLV